MKRYEPRNRSYPEKTRRSLHGIALTLGLCASTLTPEGAENRKDEWTKVYNNNINKKTIFFLNILTPCFENIYIVYHI